MSEPTNVQPRPQAIDDLLFRYSVLKAALDAAGVVKKKAEDDVNVLKAEVIALVQSFGAKHAEKSKRLKGLRNTATITTGTKTTLLDAYVEKFRLFLVKLAMPAVYKLFFTETTTYQLVASPGEVLNSLDVPRAIRTKLHVLLTQCFEVTSNAPSLKVDVAETSSAA